ncbi:MAG TPA: hypothetical protein VJ485_04075 [archaeon]|nr:hypothetical protein [archaeon]
MVRLQPGLPRRKKKGEPLEGNEHEEKRPMQDKRLLMGIVLVIGIVVFILIYLWLYPPAPPGPGNMVTDSQVRQELERLKGVNAQPSRIDPADYPKAFGVYAKNGLVLEAVYFCSDVCPDYGAVYLIYQGVDNEECQDIGEKPVHDLAWGGYIGCEPRAS